MFLNEIFRRGSPEGKKGEIPDEKKAKKEKRKKSRDQFLPLWEC
jgi:hypothetical protein